MSRDDNNPKAEENQERSKELEETTTLRERVAKLEGRREGTRSTLAVVFGVIGVLSLSYIVGNLDVYVRGRVDVAVIKALDEVIPVAVIIAGKTAEPRLGTLVAEEVQEAIESELTKAESVIDKVVETAIVEVAGTQAAEATATPTPTGTPTPLFMIQGDCDEFAPPCTYRVKSGDNYLFIADNVYADRNHAPLIMSYNRDDNGYRSLLVTDHLVFIPSATDPPPLSYLDDCGPGIKYPCLYIVQLGDTYDSVAQATYTNVELSGCIMTANWEYDTSDDKIRELTLEPGLIIVVPNTPC